MFYIGNFRFVLERSKGEYFFWAPHDDWWDVNFIQAGISALDNCKTASGAFGKGFRGEKEPKRYAKGFVFLGHQPPYNLDYDSAYLRYKSFFINNVTDVLVYAFFRRNVFNDFVWAKYGIFEKKIIAHVIGKGRIIDCNDMNFINYYLLKSNDEVVDTYRGELKNDYPIYLLKDVLSELFYFLNIFELIKIMPLFIIKGNWHKFIIKYILFKINLIKRI